MISLVSGCSTAVMFVFALEERSPFYSVTFSNLEVLNVKSFNGDSSHLSLMIFMYLKDETDGEVIILSSQRATKKMTCLRSKMQMLSSSKTSL